jgi:hypothetical protein
MADLLLQGAAWLAGQMKANAASAVVYGRGAASLPITATRGRSTFEIQDGSGGLLTVESIDWIIDPDDLVFSGSAVLPQKGDRITAGTLVCEVLPIGSEPCWRWCDQYRRQMRIHTKAI